MWRLLADAPPETRLTADADAAAAGAAPAHLLSPNTTPSPNTAHLLSPTPASPTSAKAAINESASWAWLLLFCQHAGARHTPDASTSASDTGGDATDAVAEATFHMVCEEFHDLPRPSTTFHDALITP